MQIADCARVSLLCPSDSSFLAYHQQHPPSRFGAWRSVAICRPPLLPSSRTCSAAAASGAWCRGAPVPATLCPPVSSIPPQRPPPSVSRQFTTKCSPSVSVATPPARTLSLRQCCRNFKPKSQRVSSSECFVGAARFGPPALNGMDAAMVTARGLLGIETAGSPADGQTALPASPHPIDRPQSLAMRRYVLGQCQDEEEAAESFEQQTTSGGGAVPVATPNGAPRTTSSGGYTHGAPSLSSAGVAGCGLEPAFVFVPVPSADELKDSTESFVSQFMMDVTSSWPQPTASRLRKRQNSIGKESAGARKGSTRGTNETMKTWSSRIRTALAFANFVGRTVCIDVTQPRLEDAEIDRGVRKFFRCLSPYTKMTITTFLECRRRGLAVAGGGRRLSATSLKDYSSGLSFLFSEAKVHGVRGVVPLVPDCCERTSPWQP